jgi:hypothetical protein
MPTRLIVTLALAASLLAAQPAHAGTYDVYSCRLPDGTRVPWEGWTPVDPTAADEASAGGQCVSSSLGASLNPTSAARAGAEAGWHFAAPADTVIRGLELYRWASGSATDSHQRMYDLIFDPPVSSASDAIERCSALAGCERLGAFDPQRIFVVATFDPLNRVQRAGLSALGVTARIRCVSPDSSPCPFPRSPPDAGAFGIMLSHFVLEDMAGPMFAAVPSGNLVDSAEPLTGATSVVFTATDRGSGIERTALSVDGTLYSAGPVDPSDARCRRPFTFPAPCALRQDIRLSFDTRQVAAGEHIAQAVVWDASGNEQRSLPWHTSRPDCDASIR